MVLSCLTVYAIVFSCCSLLIEKSLAVSPGQMEVTTRQNYRNRAKLAKSPREIKVLHSSYLAVHPSVKSDSVRTPNESHAYFALFDPVNNVTRKVFPPEWQAMAGQFDSVKPETTANATGKATREVRQHRHPRRSHPWYVRYKGRKVQNFVAWDTLNDSEKEVRVHYNGITAKETVVTTGVDDATGKKQGLKLRQLTDGVRFIQLIYTYDDRIQDCEYLRQKSVVDKFLATFKNDVNKAKTIKEIEEEEKEENAIDQIEGRYGGKHDEEEEEEDLDDGQTIDDGYLENDESTIERYSPVKDEEDEDEDDVDVDDDGDFTSTSFRNVTFQIIQDGDDLPGYLAEWLNYSNLKKKCRENHRVLKKLAHDSRHGDNETKKIAEEHLERVKRGVDFSLIFPGTKWCGKSSTADKYTQLGGFFKVDKCCRAHDYCHPLIKAFETKFDYYNVRPFTISHCRCDLRRKRDIMDVLLVPGTKWCGKGRRATKYTSLGGFSRTDKCCRVHDTMCPHWIGSLEEKYGLFNWRINTIMHCRCDKRFRACLKMAKTGTANFVGKLFFNVVQTKCFVLKPKEVCLKYSWWGKCEKKEYRKQAHLKDNLSY